MNIMEDTNNMLKQEIDVYILRAEIGAAMDNSIMVIEEYTGEMLLLQDNDTLLNLQVNDNCYNLTNYLKAELKDSIGVVKINYLCLSKLETINPIVIANKKSKSHSIKIQYSSAGDFATKFNNKMLPELKMLTKRCVYMEISVYKNNL